MGSRKRLHVPWLYVLKNIYRIDVFEQHQNLREVCTAAGLFDYRNLV